MKTALAALPELVTQTTAETQAFYLSTPAPCPYLPGRFERKLFTHITPDKPRATIDTLLGWLAIGALRTIRAIDRRSMADVAAAQPPQPLTEPFVSYAQHGEDENGDVAERTVAHAKSMRQRADPQRLHPEAARRVSGRA